MVGFQRNICNCRGDGLTTGRAPAGSSRNLLRNFLLFLIICSGFSLCCAISKGPQEELKPTPFATQYSVYSRDPELNEEIILHVKQLSDANEIVRAGALDYLYGEGDPERMVPVLIKALSDESPHVRMRAAEALGRFGPAASAAIPYLIIGLNDESGNVANETAGALAQIGEAAVPALIDALKSDSVMVRGRAAEALGDMAWGSRIGQSGIEAVDPLIQRLYDDEYYVRENAARALGHIRLAPEKVIPELAKLLADPAPSLQEAAVFSIGEFGPDGYMAIDPLTNMIKDKGEDADSAVFYALGQIGPGAKAATPYLFDLFGSKRRHEAARALSYIELKPEYMPYYIKFTKDADWKMDRAFMAGMLYKFGPKPEVLKALGEALDDDSEVQIAAAGSLGELGPPAKRCLPKLRKLIAKPVLFNTVRDAANDAISRIEGKNGSKRQES